MGSGAHEDSFESLRHAGKRGKAIIGGQNFWLERRSSQLKSCALSIGTSMIGILRLVDLGRPAVLSALSTKLS